MAIVHLEESPIIGPHTLFFPQLPSRALLPNCLSSYLSPAAHPLNLTSPPLLSSPRPVRLRESQATMVDAAARLGKWLGTPKHEQVLQNKGSLSELSYQIGGERQSRKLRPSTQSKLEPLMQSRSAGRGFPLLPLNSPDPPST
jgi:hypothetical protein